MKFIKLHTIHPDDVMQDSELFLSVETITAIQVPTPVDRKRREEINAIVLTKFGGYAVTEKTEKILETLKEIDYQG